MNGLRATRRAIQIARRTLRSDGAAGSARSPVAGGMAAVSGASLIALALRWRDVGPRTPRAHPCHAAPCPALPGRTEPGPARPCPAAPRQALPCHASPRSRPLPRDLLHTVRAAPSLNRSAVEMAVRLGIEAVLPATEPIGPQDADDRGHV